MNVSRYGCWTFGILFVSLAAGLSRADTPSATDPRVKAATEIQQLTQSDPSNPELWVHLGFARQKLNDTDGAQEAFEKAAALDAKNLDARYMLGLIYEKKHQNADALRVWKEYLAVAPNAEKRDLAQKHIHQLNQ